MNAIRIGSAHNKLDDPRCWQFGVLLWWAAVLCVSATGAHAYDKADSQVKELRISDRIQIADGHMVVCWEQKLEQPAHLLIHFHGAPEAIGTAFLRSRLNVVLVVVNFPGLSSAYSTPFARDEQLFEHVVARATRALSATARPTANDWERITVSSFSAGFGAVREILKTQRYFDQIDAVVAADSIYAGVDESLGRREVNKRHMQDFLKFAQQACNGEKTFILSHSSQSTPYASTTETADYLLRALNMARTTDASIRSAELRQLSRASRGRFTVLGFDGESGKDHMQHLHNIDLLWDRVAAGN